MALYPRILDPYWTRIGPGELAAVPRQVRDASLETRTARARLKAVHKPYFRLIEPGLHLGYRRLANGPGTWVVRRYGGGGKYTVKNLFTARPARHRRRLFRRGRSRHPEFRTGAGTRTSAGANGGAAEGRYTVNQAADDYIQYLRDEGRDESAIRTRRGASMPSSGRASANPKSRP